MDKINLLCVAPYANLKETIYAVAREMPELTVHVHLGDLEEALSIASTLRTADYDVLVSRGGTAQLLRSNVDIPVVEIGISVYDVLRVIKLAQQTGRSFAVIGFSSITNAARLIADILQYDIPIGEIHTSADAQELILQMAAAGVELFLGDAVTANTARSLGMSCLLITSGPESVRSAFHEAQYLCECNQLALRNSYLLRDALNDIRDSVAIYNQAGYMIYVNHAPLTMTLAAFLEILKKCMPDLKESGSIDVIRRNGNMRLSIHGYTVTENSNQFYIFRTSPSYISQELPTKAITQYNYDEISASASSAYLFPDSVHQTLRAKLSGSNKPPIFIYGESGTCRTELAKYIHLCYLSPSSTFTEIDCSRLSEKEWTNAVEDSDSPLYTSSGTLFFRNIYSLSPALQKKVGLFMEDTPLHNRVHIIFSSSLNMHELSEKGGFSSSLFLNFGGLPIRIPPISERIGDIPAICGAYISRFNLTLSKQIIGFTEEGMRLMQDFDWPQNSYQIEIAVKQLVNICTGSYIEADDVRTVLGCMSGVGRKESEFDLNKTLDEIELDIITHVLAEENMNQTTTAERLGISRSTLWRKLQLKS